MFVVVFRVLCVVVCLLLLSFVVVVRFCCWSLHVVSCSLLFVFSLIVVCCLLVSNCLLCVAYCS